MRLDRDTRVIAPRERIPKNLAHPALAFAGPVVIGVVLRGVPCGVLDVDVHGMIAHVLPELPRVLFRPRLGLGAVGIKDGIGRVEDPLEAGNFVQQLQRVLPAHAAIVHAVLVDGLQAGIKKHVCHVLHAAEDFRGYLILLIARLETHHPDVLRAEPLHPGYGPLHLGERDLERVADFLGPVHDGRTEAINAHPRFIQLSDGQVERLLGNVVKVRLRETRHLHSARLQIFPPELGRRRDLAVNRVRPFVANARKNHKLTA